MAQRRQPRIIILASIFLFIFLAIVFHTTVKDGVTSFVPTSWREQAMEEFDAEEDIELGDLEGLGNFPMPKYEDAIARLGAVYNRTVVVTSMTTENTSWVEAFADDPLTNFAIYHVDDPAEPFVVPENKGRELMVYLSYIIDFYDKLDDVTVFVHAHQRTWHNNDLLEGDVIEHLRHLKSRAVVKWGYRNLRCAWDPGCPPHIHPASGEDSMAQFPEAHTFTNSFKQLFPNHPIPEHMGQTCCSQFAVSRERIRALPKAQYEYFRSWLLQCPFKKTGRLWEYIWQYVFTGEEVVCPSELECYCDNYGLCLDSTAELHDLHAARFRFENAKDTIKKLESGEELSPDPEKEIEYFKSQLDELETTYLKLKKEAFARDWE